MNDTIDIIGIKTETEALALIEKERQEMIVHNKAYKKENLRGLFLTSFFCLVLVVAARILTKDWGIAGIICVGSLALVTYLSCNSEYQICFFQPTDFSLPCQYYRITKNKNILQIKEHNGELGFVLEDVDTHIVTEATLTGFETVYRTDISNILVDLEKSCIAYPYPKGGNNS